MKKNMSKVLALLVVVAMLCGVLPTGFVLPVAAAKVDNMIVNGDFETGNTDGWGSWDVTAQNKYAKNGNYGAGYDGGAWRNLNQTVNVVKNAYYRVSFWYKGNLTLYFQGNGADNIWDGTFGKRASGNYPVVNEYTFHSFVFNSGSYDSFKFDFQTQSNGAFSVDDVVMERVYIPNGDFESGNMNGWDDVWDATAQAKYAHNGSYGMGYDGGAWRHAGMKTIPVEKNTKYEISFWYKGNLAVYFKGDVSDTYWNDINGKQVSNNYPVADTYTFHSFVVDSGNNASFSIDFQNFSSGAFSVDDVTMVKVKEPSNDGYITNGDFETGDLNSWQMEGWANTKTTVVEADGDYCAKVETGSAYYGFYQLLTLEKNTNYRLSLKFKSPSASKPMFYLKQGNLGSTIANPECPVDGTGWNNYEYAFNSGENTSVTLQICAGWSAKEVYFDDVMLKKVEDPSFDGFITNGDFETGDMTGGWSTGKASISNEQAKDSYSLKMTGASQYDGTTLKVNVEKNKTYRLSYDVYSVSAANWKSQLFIKSMSNGDMVSGDYVYPPSVPAGKWTTYTVEFNSGENTYVTFQFCIGVANNTKYLDNVTMREVKDPSNDGYIINGDFETGDNTGWPSNWGGTAVYNKANAMEGNFGVGVSGSGWDSIKSGAIAVEANTNYHVTGWYKGAGVVYIKKSDGSTDITSIWPNNPSSWKQFDVSFNSGDQTTIYIEMGCGGNAAISFDNVSMRKVKDPSFDGYIYNGDFETGDKTGNWFGNIEVTKEAAKDGDYGVKVSSGNGEWDDYCALENKSIAVTPNTDYVLTFDHMSPTGVQGCVIVKGVVNGTVQSVEIGKNYPKCDAGQWVSDSIAFNSGEYSMIYIQLCVFEKNSYRYYDNVKLVSYSDNYVTGGQASVTESGDKVGVAFKFDLDASVTFKTPYTFTGGTVVPGAGKGSYTLVKMGAVLTNKAANADKLTLENVDGKAIIDIAAEKVIDVTADSVSYAVRVINIPSSAKGTLIYAVPYYIYNDGTKDVTVYATTVYSESFNSIESRTSYTDSTKWELYWNDEFGGTEVDQTKWNVSMGDNGISYKTNRPENVKVENGDLVLTVQREDYNGKDYTVGYVGTENKFSFLYGRMEIRAKMPTGHGVWPALWTMGDLYMELGDELGWPYAGEIDILEIVGEGEKNSEECRTYSHNLHWGLDRNEHCEVGSYTLSGYNNHYVFPQAEHPADVYHVYAIEWGHRDIKFFVDDVMVSHVWWTNTQFYWQNYGESQKNQSLLGYPHNDDDGGKKTTATALDTAFCNEDNPHWLIMNVGLNAGWGDGSNAVNSSTPMPTSMYVDYVRVYKAAE